ncbi:MAG: hypothetical protein WA705_16800 [Candidatus Ozemobacteraceae bacterium]
MGMWTIPDGAAESGRFSPEELHAFMKMTAEAISARGMSVPAVLFLELAKPMSFVGGAAMQMFGPLLEMLFDAEKYEKLRAVLGDRKNIEEWLRVIEKTP